MTVGERIKNRRKELGLSADTLADKIGISRSTMFRYESGYIEKFPAASLEPIAIALNTSVKYLMGWTDDADSQDENIEMKELVRNYQDASPEIQKAAFNMLKDSAEGNRKRGKPAESSRSTG